jgi:hypothetical protein
LVLLALSNPLVTEEEKNFLVALSRHCPWKLVLYRLCLFVSRLLSHKPPVSLCLVVYSFEFWLFLLSRLVSYSCSGIGTRKAPREVRLLTDIRVVQAAVQVAAKVAEELAEGLRRFFFERAEEVNVQEEEKERKQEKEQKLVQTLAAAEVGRANLLICDQIAALETFTGDPDAWYGWQKSFRRLTQEFDKDLQYESSV